ncbi:PucR family transcriptional regulator [Rhodococcus aetherivorans]
MPQFENPQPVAAQLEPEDHQLLVDVANRLVPRMDAITQNMTAVLMRLGPLGEDPPLKALLESSIHANLGMILHLWTEDLEIDDLRPMPASVTYARRLAQRGVPWNLLIRAYHVGHNRLCDQLCQELLTVKFQESGQLRVLQYATDTAFAYVDAMTSQLHDIYQREIRRSSSSSVSRAGALVHAALSGSDETDIFDRFGYPIRAFHIGLVIWNPEPQANAGRAHVEREDVCHSLAAALDGEHVLAVDTDEGTTTAWITRNEPAVLTADQLCAALGELPRLRVVAGQSLAGSRGFRASHRQALAAYRLAGVADPAPSVLSFSDPGVAVAAMAAHDVESLRTWIGAVLGPLAADDETSARLRETTLAFLQASGSHTVAAENLFLHRNTVRNRLEQVARLRQRSVDEDRHDLETALLCARWVGRPVLASA